MKHRRIIIASLVLCLTLALVQVALVASNDLIPPQDREIVHVPHSYECHISVAPAIPTITDTIQITVSDLAWSLPCVPTYTSHQLISNQVRIDLTYNPLAVCIPEPMPWQHTVNIGVLPSGVYEAKAYINNFPCASRTFVVFERVIPLYLPIITRQSGG